MKSFRINEDYRLLTVYEEFDTKEAISVIKSKGAARKRFKQKLYNFMANDERIKCSITFEEVNRPAIDYVKLSGYCRIKEDHLAFSNANRKFIAVLTFTQDQIKEVNSVENFLDNSFTKVKVIIFGNLCDLKHLKLPKTRPITGEQKTEIENMLQESSAAKVRDKINKKAYNADLLERKVVDCPDGSMPYVGQNQMEKIKSNALLLNRKSNCPLLDLKMELLLSEPKNRLIRQIVDKPYEKANAHVEGFQVHIHNPQFDEIVAKFYKLSHRKRNPTPFIIYFDATGELVKKPECIVDGHHDHAPGRILNYHFMCQVETKPVILAETISSVHTTGDIKSILALIANRVAKYAKIPFQILVLDFSWAEIHAGCEEFNKSSTERYINDVYNGRPVLTIIALCVSHVTHIFVKAFRRLTTGHQVTYSFRNFILNVMCLLINARTFDQILLIYKHSLTIVRHKNVTHEVALSIRALNEMVQKKDISEEDPEIKKIFEKEEEEEIGEKPVIDKKKNQLIGKWHHKKYFTRLSVVFLVLFRVTLN